MCAHQGFFWWAKSSGRMGMTQEVFQDSFLPLFCLLNSVCLIFLHLERSLLISLILQ